MAPPIAEEFPFDRSRAANSRESRKSDKSSAGEEIPFDRFRANSPEDQFLSQRKSQYEMNQQPPYQAPYEAGGDTLDGNSSVSSSLPDYRLILQTPEGLQVLRECNRESFWSRCIPLSTASMFSEVLATRAGYIKVARFPVFRTAMAGFSGYLLGRMSYAGKCRQKLERLWRSPEFADRLSELQRSRPPTATAPVFGQPQRGAQVMQPFGGRDAVDVDVDPSTNVQHQGLDDSNRPSLDNEANFQLSEEADIVTGRRKAFTSYEELRKRNRDEHERKLRDQYSRTYGRDHQGGGPASGSRPSAAPSASSPGTAGGGESTFDGRASEEYTPDSRPDENYRFV